MNWIQLTTEEEIQNIINSDKPAVIYKHSTRCMVSLMALKKLKSEATVGADIPFYMVDVIKDRAISMSVANVFGVGHESPQLLLVKNEQCLYDASHEAVSLKPLEAYL